MLLSEIIGSVVERAPTSKPSSSFTPGPSNTGFPQAAHRSKKSAFARARESSNRTLRDDVPFVVPSKPTPLPPLSQGNGDDWRTQISRENELRVSAMSDEEREQERREILERFGPGIKDILKKAREAKERNATYSSAPSELNTHPSASSSVIPANPDSGADPLPPALTLASPAGSRPTSRASRKLRFADVTPNDVHVYESAPSSPRKKALALPAPSPGSDAVSLGKWGGKHPSSQDKDTSEPEPEEGSPEYIRRRFFPSAPAHNSDLAWMDDAPPPPGSSGPPSSTLRFDLSGNPLATTLHSSLPTHLDVDGVQRAGYTLDDIFLIMRMLVGIAHWVGAVHRGVGELRDVVLTAAAGIEAMGERGSLGAHAVEVLWHDDPLVEVEDVELGDKDSSLPLSHLLPQIAELSGPSNSSTSLSHLLAILHRMACQTNDTATKIVSTPSLVPSLFRIFLLAGATTSAADSYSALDLLTALATSTRANAQAIAQPADALLRFVTTLPPPEPSLLTVTLKFYKALAAYGLYSHIASTAHLPFAALAQYVFEHVQNRGLVRAWAGLLEVWIVCATDPHQTTPGHDILWSQVVAWGWGEDLLALRAQLGVSAEDCEVWAAVWRATAAWLEGARINGARSGEKEREECVLAIKTAFESNDGKENTVVRVAMTALSGSLNDFGHGDTSKLRDLGRFAEILMAAIRLWLACLPPTEGPHPSYPFVLPFVQLSELCAKLVTHPVWSQLSSCGSSYVLYRPLAGLLARYLRLSQRLPDVSQDVWMAQALAIISRILPGDEDFAVQVADQIFDLISPQWAASRGIKVPPTFWDKSGLAVIKPFLAHTVRPRDDIYTGPWYITPTSIKCATTQRLPPPSSAFSRDYALPLSRDWTFSPLNHLLRSGTSAVFNNLSSSWDGSEVDVTRAALLLTKICREVSSRFSFVDFVLTREEAIFGCMKVFMLEHGQTHSDTADELMEDLLDRYAVVAASSAPPSDLEQVSMAFLGAHTPFYQFYTDFVALYDAISFSDPTFARLLLPPTSMRYAPDYRRLLWNDFGHILKTIRTSPECVVSGDLSEYLWPVETDPQMLGAYLRALIKIPLEGFLRLVAVHHVASNIWPNLRKNSAELGEERAERLLKAVIDQGSHEVVADILQYSQVRAGNVRVPPACFQIDEDIRATRLEYVRHVGGEALVGQVRGLLQ
ncbi:hypothetical protein GGX14DRAFT_657639 [Mycena pura]|uniref:RNA polymerase II-associated protein 1 C-terminal domain-containing protein n=1 Tax=Mycena pura TaxID=153505 RepID=A0AAD6YLU2_9AGAR|nr:hypothetical protein GGX14DRAFT_657639 [Mycena pura]